MQSAEENRHASVSELAGKHQKGMIQKKTEVEAASTGEAVWLKATMEEIKGELAHLKGQHGYLIRCMFAPMAYIQVFASPHGWPVRKSIFNAVYDSRVILHPSKTKTTRISPPATGQAYHREKERTIQTD